MSGPRDTGHLAAFALLLALVVSGLVIVRHLVPSDAPNPEELARE